MTHAFIVDLTQERLSDPTSVLQTVRRFVHSKFPGSHLEWVVKKDHANYLSGERSATSDEESICEYLRTRVSAMSNDGFRAATFHFVSYNTKVLALAGSLTEAERAVVPHHVLEVRKAPTGPGQPAGAGGVLTVEEGLDIAIEALERGNHLNSDTGLPIVSLRPEMIKVDNRAMKVPADPVSAQLMKFVLKRGLETKKLGYTSLGPGKEVVWAAQPEEGSIRQSAKVESPRQTLPPVPAPESQMILGRLPIVQNLPPHRDEARWSVFFNAIKGLGICPPTLAREYLYRILSDVKIREHHGPITVNQLLTMARERAILEAESDSSINYSPKQWSAFANCLMRLLLRSSTLLHRLPGKAPDECSLVPIQPGTGSLSTPVADLKDRFAERCDAYILLQVIRVVPGVRSDEHTSLGLVLYRRGRDNDQLSLDEIRERADRLLTLLKSEGLIEEVDGFLKVV